PLRSLSHFSLSIATHPTNIYSLSLHDALPICSLEMLAKFDLKKYFTDAVTAEKKFPRKPNPASLNSLVEKYDLDPQNCVMIGDRVRDIAAARNAKMSGILFDPDDLIIEPASPEHRIQDMHDILNWIK